MKIIIKLLIILSFSFIYLVNISYSAINFTVSPIKYEIDAQTWSIITKTAKLRNNSDNTVEIFTEKLNFTVNNTLWIPDFIYPEETHPHPEQELVSWITINTDSFIIWPDETKEITFTINVPENATPWWHYWAVFFRNKNDNSVSIQNWVGVNVDYWVLILVKINWEIISEWEVWEISITSWWWWWNLSTKEEVKDDCPLWDLSWNEFDWKCTNQEDLDNFDEKINLDEQDKKEFNITFDIPFKNKWNTHLKPQWKIVLKDENWNVIKKIWKKIISNDKWAVIWEDIVDYIPINDAWGNVLPYSDRDFLSEWKGFPYKTYDDEWNPVINYWNPSEYYTKKNKQNAWYLMFWEKVKERTKTKQIEANINISYKDINWKMVEFNSAKTFDIKYKETYVGLNYFIVIPFCIFILILLLYFLFKKLNRKYRCRKCNKEIKKNRDVCPYCLKKQKRKK